MDSESLLTFLTIHRTGGFSNAAAALRRSQPAISRRIALLEENLGVPVFERTAGGIKLSSAGQALLPYARTVLATLNDAESAIRTLRDANSGPVSLALVGTLAGANLTPLLKRFARNHPGVELTIRTASSSDVSEAVRRGNATLGLRYLLDPSSDLICEHVGDESVRVVCAPGHRLAGRTIKSLAALRDEPWFAFPNAWEHRESFENNIFAQFQRCGVGSIRWTPVDSLTAQKRLIEAGFGLALIPDSAVQEERRDRSLDTITVRDFKATTPVYSIVRNGGYLSPAAAELLRRIGASPGAFGKPIGSRRAQRPQKR